MDHIRDLIVRAVAVLSRIKPIEELISLVSGVVFSLAGRKPTGDVYRNENAEQYHQRHEKQEWWHTEHREFGSLIHRLPPKISVLDVPLGRGASCLSISSEVLR